MFRFASAASRDSSVWAANKQRQGDAYRALALGVRLKSMDQDEDLIRGVGYMVIQASHLEREIEELCRWLHWAFPRPKNHEAIRVSDKIKWCKQKIKEANDHTLESLDQALDKAMNLLEKRNKLVHGQIYFASSVPEKIISTKKGVHERVLLASEAYDLAKICMNFIRTY